MSTPVQVIRVGADEGEQRLVHDRRVLAVDELADLLLRGGDDLGVAVPGAHDTDAGGEVEVTPSVGVEDLAPEGVVDGHGGGLLEQGGQRCHREPPIGCLIVDNTSTMAETARLMKKESL